MSAGDAARVGAAIHAARSDFLAVVHRAEVVAEANAPGARTIVVHGDHISPSWRALPGGERVWDEDPGEDPVESPTEAYEEELDRLTDNYLHEDGYSLGWEDGNLFVYGPDYSEED